MQILIAGSCYTLEILVPIDLRIFGCDVTVDFWMDGGAGSSQIIILGKREEAHSKAKFWCKLNRDALFPFFPDIYYLHNRLF